MPRVRRGWPIIGELLGVASYSPLAGPLRFLNLLPEIKLAVPAGERSEFSRQYRRGRRAAYLIDSIIPGNVQSRMFHAGRLLGRGTFIKMFPKAPLGGSTGFPILDELEHLVGLHYGRRR